MERVSKLRIKEAEGVKIRTVLSAEGLRTALK